MNISVAGYPQTEFGFLTGTVRTVSLLADEEGMYMATVDLPQDLRTSYGRRLTFNGELSGAAEVVTEEKSVMSRMLGPLRYLWEKYF